MQAEVSVYWPLPECCFPNHSAEKKKEKEREKKYSKKGWKCS